MHTCDWGSEEAEVVLESVCTQDPQQVWMMQLALVLLLVRILDSICPHTNTSGYLSGFRMLTLLREYCSWDARHAYVAPPLAHELKIPPMPR
jgi:hypothetical protein